MKLKIGADVYRNSDIEFEKQLARPVKRQIDAVLSITEKSAQELLLSLTDENSITITKTIIKDEIAKNQEKMKETWIKQFSKTGSSDFYIDKIEISNSLELPFLPISEINDLRRIMLEELMEKRIEHYNKFIKEVQKPIKYAKYYIDEVDYRANVHNKSAYDFYAKCGTNVKEYSYELNKPNRQVTLMKCKHCIKYALNMCKSNKNLILRDTHGQTYPLKFNCKDCEMYVMSN
jgi:putative protease